MNFKTIMTGLLILFSATIAQDDSKFSFTISPIHLSLPVVEATTEASLTPPSSASFVLSYGSMTASNSFEEIKIPVLEIGIQDRYYLLDDFKGLMTGFEAL